MFDDYIDLIIVKFIWLSQDKLLSFRLEWTIHGGIIPPEKSMIPMFSRYRREHSIIKPCTDAEITTPFQMQSATMHDITNRRARCPHRAAKSAEFHLDSLLGSWRAAD